MKVLLDPENGNRSFFHQTLLSVDFIGKRGSQVLVDIPIGA